MSRLRRRDRETGAAAVEFALVVLPLLIIVFGIITFGYMLSFRQAMSQAAAEGARAAAVAMPNTPSAERVTRATDAVNAAVGYGVDCDHPGMTCAIVVDSSCGANGCIRVTLTYAYRANPLTPLFPGLGLAMPEQLSYTAMAEVS
ncbi:TadE/TadG family type IV pilus assembly protein [Nocardioides limicola]|uniref:TadE/TadG family type IV pilus assembly protein n=1 Tax=Nocardioides limicola TaxID=2803368 RepID=UPI00193B77BD|nr:TadE/TadG family type IV pilus assembly protein [Nocardioides sp. DJM-14]